MLALDIPSGLCADTGGVLGCAVRADVTVTFIGMKRGLVTGSGPDHAGDIVLDTLGVPDDCHRRGRRHRRRCSGARLRQSIPQRAATAYKHQSGHVLIVGGDSGMGGAVAMAAEAALRVGAGLVSVVTRPEHVAAVLARRPEIMVQGVDDADAHGLDALIERATVIAIGPGLGRGDWGRALLERVLRAGKPMVVDADGLHLLAQHARVAAAACADGADAARRRSRGVAGQHRRRHPTGPLCRGGGARGALVERRGDSEGRRFGRRGW